MFGFMLGSYLAKIYVDIGFVDLGTVVISVRFYTTAISPVISEQVLLESKRSNSKDFAHVSEVTSRKMHFGL